MRSAPTSASAVYPPGCGYSADVIRQSATRSLSADTDRVAGWLADISASVCGRSVGRPGLAVTAATAYVHTYTYCYYDYGTPSSDSNSNNNGLAMTATTPRNELAVAVAAGADRYG